jgi:hypothetical protein
MVFSFKIFTFHEANTCVAFRTPDGLQCAHYPSVITNHNKNGSENAVVKTVELM